jgi:hypothetical protein
MTRQQKQWLDKNRTYRVVGQRAGHTRYAKLGILHADGKFDLHQPGSRARVTPGSFEVGVLENIIPGQPVR